MRVDGDRNNQIQLQAAYSGADSSKKPGTDEKKGTGAEKSAKDSRETQAEVSQLKAAEARVRAHELAHTAAGRGFTGTPTYSYTTGPDGKKYISGGEVPISTPKGSTPEETISNMRQVRAAALAPADPSPQDISVASSAGAAEQKARHEKAREAHAKQESRHHKKIDLYA